MSTERIKLPGLIDSHVHLREPGSIHKEDFETGTKSALAGGFTTIIDMPNNSEPTISLDALQNKITLTKNRIYCNLGFHFGATETNFDQFKMVENQVFGLKVYMNDTTGNLLMENFSKLQQVFQKWPKEKPIIVHAEGKKLLTAISLARQNNKRLHIAHVATKKDIEIIRNAKNEGLLVTCEVTPHHLFLTEKDSQSLGPFGMMKPSLGTEEDRLALWKYLKMGVIDIISCDHAPHTKEEKLSINPPFGVPGLETTLPLLLTTVAENKLTLDDLVRLTYINPRKIFGIKKIQNTYIEIDLKESYEINAANLQTKCVWSPFEGKRVVGKVIKVVLKSKTVFDGEKIVGKPKGEIIYPSIR